MRIALLVAAFGALTSCVHSIPSSNLANTCQDVRNLTDGDVPGFARVAKNIHLKNVALTVDVEPPSRGEGAVTLAVPTVDEVDAMITPLVKEPLLGTRPIEWAQVLNQCEDRAHVAAGTILGRHPNWPVGKVFVRAEGGLGAANGLVNWGYHVALFVAARGRGDELELRVLDPAFDNQHSLAIDRWLDLAVDAETAKTVTVELRPASVWQNGAGAGEFCSETEKARQILAAQRLDPQSRGRQGLLVEQLDDGDQPRAWFSDANGDTGWFAVNAATLPVLRSAIASNRHVDIEYSRVRLGFLRGSFLNVTSASFAELSATRLISAFRQGNAGNCASIGIIKAALYAYPPSSARPFGPLRNWVSTNTGFTATTMDGVTVEISQGEYARRAELSRFVTQDDADLTELGQKLFLVMSKRLSLDPESGVSTLETAAERLNNGQHFKNTPPLLGLTVIEMPGGGVRRYLESIPAFTAKHQSCVAARSNHAWFVGGGLADVHGRARPFRKRTDSTFAMTATNALCVTRPVGD